MFLTPLATELLFTRHDPQDPRLGERVKPATQLPQETNSVILVGHPEDEGIQKNGGRPGASQAPFEIRKFLYKMTPPAHGPFPSEIFDLGDFQKGSSFEDRVMRAREILRRAHQQQNYVLSLGGGHDVGFPDAAAFLDIYQGKNPLIINFDAHLDVRPRDKGDHSGTPFRRLLEEFPKKFEFWEVGLQAQCNSKFHAQWAEAQGAQLVFLDDFLKANPETLGLEPSPQRPCWLSLDIDVFSSKEAPGCSQSWARGLLIEDFLPWLQFFSQNFDLRGMGIYEVSPPLDIDSRTSKLAALLLYQALRWKK